MHKLYFELATLDQWYAIMREARAQFGKNWRSQSHVRRKLSRSMVWGTTSNTERVWFEVPDPKFGTWVAIKHAVRQIETPGK